MSRQLDVDQVLSSWLAEGGERAPERSLLAALEQVETISQRRPARVGARLSTMWSTVTHSHLGLVAAAVAAIAIGLALSIGSGWVGENDPSPTPTAEPTPTSSPPEPSGSGTYRSETSLGTVEWTKVTSDQPIWAWRVVGDEVLGMNYENSSLWTLSDSLAWEPASTPELGLDATYLGADGNELAVISPDGGDVMMGPASARQVISRDYSDGGDEAIYRREDAEWIEVEVPEVTPPATAGLRILGPRLQGAAALNESSWIVPAIYHIEVPWGDIFGQYPWNGEQVDPFPIWNEGLGQLRIIEPESSNPFAGAALATLTVELADGDPPVIEFRDATTGDLVHTVSATLPGWSPEALLTALQGWGLEDVSFLVNRGGEISVVRPPWPAGEEWSESTRIVTAFGKYYAVSHPLGPDYSVTAIHLWESTDGLEWTPVDLPQMHSDGLDWVALAGKAEGMVMSVFETSESASVWETTDGRDWRQADVSEVSTGVPEATDFGWLMNAFDAAAISADGSAWEPIDVPPLPAEPSVQYLGGIFIYGPGLVDGEYRTWIGRLAE